ncbi:MAG TPA: hypothetical protein VJO35_14135 [Terriglobales bacterium]|nr:hypothetical protein [Terriglobales bacterium]
MACPFFLPNERADDLAFPHPARLPLGSGWRGRCCASGKEQTVLDAKELESCNLGYATTCPRLPAERACDAVRFVVVNDSADEVTLQFVMEAAYRPAGHGFLKFDRRSGDWSVPHPDQLIQKKAECFLQSHFERTSRQ